MKTSTTEIDMVDLAAKFINTTAKNIFLTGKAGTGKTTFLQQLGTLTHKKFLVAAPTGIAALNAGGVTLHSQFLLPLGSYIPEGNVPVESGNFFDANYLVRRNPLNSDRKNTLREIDLLIIDEVSMLRADILDAIDFRLRNARKQHGKPFGGVQLLLIGDLFQLPPVVKDHEMRVMKNYYPNLYFFESLALKKSEFAYIEFDKIYRQSDADFIGMLNRLRTNSTTREDIDRINRRCIAEDQIPKNTITLTTHNRQADAINQRKLDSLPGKAQSYKAIIEGTFPDSMFPLNETLVLKEKTRVMFVKNDPEGRFFNGMIATVTHLDPKFIRVKPSGQDREMDIEPMQWTNSKYKVNDTTMELDEEIIGSFTQFPFKYAWAVTVHKSQGLTFARAVMDVGSAFAPGQVYVALSRLTSLDGLYLRTPINPNAVMGDSRIHEFSSTKNHQPPPFEMLKRGQATFADELLSATFDFSSIMDQIDQASRKRSEKLSFPEESMSADLMNLKALLYKELNNTAKFRRQLSGLLAQGENQTTIDRIDRGSRYYSDYLFEVLEAFLRHDLKVKRMPRTKAYQRLLGEIDHAIMKKLSEVERASEIINGILHDRTPDDFSAIEKIRTEKRDALIAQINEELAADPVWKEMHKKASGRGKKRGKIQKGATYTETFNLIKEGLGIKEIAIKRSLTETTIQGHVAHCIADGRLSVDKFMQPEELKVITEKMQEIGWNNLSDAYAAFDGKYSYQKLRMARGHLQYLDKSG